MNKQEFDSNFRKLTLEQVEEIISKYSDCPFDETINLNKYFDEKKDKPIRVKVTDEDRKKMNEFVHLRHNAYAAYAMFDIEDQSFHKLMKKKPAFPKEASDPANKLILDYLSDAKVFLDALEVWSEKHLPNYFQTWNNIRKNLYSTSVSYRICYNLRNFVQHQMLVPIKAVTVYSSNQEDYILDGDALVKDTQFIKNVGIDPEFLKDDRNLVLKKYISYYHSQIHYLYLLAMRKFFKQRCQELMELHNYFAKRNFPHRLYELITTKRQLIISGQASYYLLDTHDTISNFLTQLIKWGFVDYDDYKTFIKK